MKLQDQDASSSSLSVRDVYLAMVDYLCTYTARVGDDLYTLLSGSCIETDGEPFDPAAFADFMDSVGRVRASAARTTFPAPGAYQD